jgi:hypothetical protein
MIAGIPRAALIPVHAAPRQVPALVLPRAVVDQVVVGVLAGAVEAVENSA